MGSHGGGTAEGQRTVIEAYGITEEFCGCPIRASMETVVVCQTAEGFPVHFDRHAFEADHVVVCNRVKPHTDFVGDIESGLMKMMLIGLGKHDGSQDLSPRDPGLQLRPDRPQRGRPRCSRSCRIVAGLAIVENAYDQTANIAAVAPQDFEPAKRSCCVLASNWCRGCRSQRVDMLIIDEIGKNISGTGMDTNVVGRKFNDHEPRRATNIPR